MSPHDSGASSTSNQVSAQEPPGDRSVGDGPFLFDSDIGPTENRYALLIGVSNYVDAQYFGPLPSCERDVLALEPIYTKLGYSVVVMHESAPLLRLRPTRDNIEAELANLGQIAGPNDLALVHFSGHGTLVDGEPALIAHETRRALLAEKALTLSQLKKRLLAKSRVNRCVIFLDACHSGVSGARGPEEEAYVRHVYELARGFTVLSASTAEQLAYVRPDVQLGAFTSFVIEALLGRADTSHKGFITVDDIRKYTLAKLRSWGYRNNVIQEPTANLKIIGDMIIADRREAERALPWPSSPPPPGPHDALARAGIPEAAAAAALPPAGLVQTSATASLRKLIAAVLRSDTDIDAFCLDHFPSIQRRFTNHMDRVQKVSMILTHAQPEEIRAALQAYSPHDYAEAVTRGA